VEKEIKKLPFKLRKLLKGTMLTRDLTQKAKSLFEYEKFDHEKFGLFLTKQQEILRDYLEVSTLKINKMIDAALNTGALGAKINGSGEGGCIFAYAPEKYEEVAEAIKKVGGKPYIINISEGVKLDLKISS
jgi:galactokinase